MPSSPPSSSSRPAASSAETATAAPLQAPPPHLLPPEIYPEVFAAAAGGNAEAAAAAATAAGSAQDGYNLYEVLSVLTSFGQNQQRLKLLHVSLSVVRFFSILNFVYTLLGVILLAMALSADTFHTSLSAEQRDYFFRVGMVVSIFAPFLTFVDFLALRGLHLWRRSYLLPWLFLYAFIISMLFANTLSGIMHRGFRWTYIVLLLLLLGFYSTWRTINRMYNEMARERPVERSAEDLAGQLRRVRETSERAGLAAGAADPPPKYEDLEQPPVYGGAGGGAAAAAVEDEPPVYAEVFGAGAASSAQPATAEARRPL